ncbi:MAG: hypothetical protein B7X55_08315 [Rhodobacterales bacterium 34-62-10]|nr:MAG: hypothetical protein B7X55_08315 [Rhodobacterales bacterium 34-62-10]
MSVQKSVNIAPQPTDFDDILLLVGRLNYTWTNTESLLLHLIAGLSGTTKDVATVIFLTLNTTRARVDLVERLAKMDHQPPAERDGVLRLTREMMKLSGARNRFNHCIYAFDPDGGPPKSILMRIADRKDGIRMGQTLDLDAAAMDTIRKAITDLARINQDIWAHIARYGYPA